MSLLGRRFLRIYYESVLDYQRGMLIVVLDSSQNIVGFAAGFIDGRNFYKFLDQRKLSMMIWAGFHVALRPHIWRRVIENMRTVEAGGHNSSATDEVFAELASIGVSPALFRSGCGRMLVEEFLYRSALNGASKVYLTTDSDRNEAVNKFYDRLGFVRAKTFEKAGGRKMNLYVRSLG